MKMLGCVMAIVIFTVIGTELSLASECKVTDDNIIIGMVKDKILPRYYINITNHYSESIIFFEVGSIEQKEVQIIKTHVPVNFFAPPGWSGKHVFGYESEYMYSGPHFQDNSLRWCLPQKGAGNERTEAQKLHQPVQDESCS